MRLRWTSVVTAAVAALGLAACAPVDSGGGSPTTAPAPTSSAASPAAALDTVTVGKLTIATSEPAYEPWMVDDDPTNGKGYETAVAYAVADRLGFAKDDVVWVRQTFDQLIAPGVKAFDFAINQVSITDERAANVDFSSSYYDTAQAVVTVQGSKAEGAKSLADLKDAKRRSLRVHGRTGQPCLGWDGVPCGDTVYEVSFADSSLQYCPTCQTGGRPLADRRLSRLLR